MSIPEIFKIQGEAGFRKIESQVLSELGMQSGLIIATGGGCVTVYENYRSLHQNGTIIWLQRDLDRLPTVGRPLSQSQDLSRMFEIRRPMYAGFSDITADNNDTAENTVDTILSALAQEV